MAEFNRPDVKTREGKLMMGFYSWADFSLN